MTHLVWDWNGTLLDDLALTVRATNAALAALGGPSVTVEQHRRDFCRPLVDYYAAVVGRPLDDGEFALLDEAFHRTYEAGLAACGLTADAEAAIAAWPGTQSLLSLWSHERLVPELGRRGLLDRMIRAEGRAGTVSDDLKSAHLARHLAAIGVPGDRCVLIGDAVDDARAAASVGARCVLFTEGITDPQVLRATEFPVASSLLEAVAVAAAGAVTPGGTPAQRGPADAAPRLGATATS